MTDSSSANRSFPRGRRLQTSREFERVFARNVVAADDVLVVTACANDRGVTRLGLSVSRKVGNAVIRNRWKRLIREAFRLQQASLPGGVDLVVRPRKDALPEFHAVCQSLRRLVPRVQHRLNGNER